MSDNFIKIAEPYKRTVGNVTYIVSAFGNANARPRERAKSEDVMRLQSKQQNIQQTRCLLNIYEKPTYSRACGQFAKAHRPYSRVANLNVYNGIVANAK
ncbi:MAG: hypothetical protein LIO53_07465 [Oscillospiraceae bacterium]|nr:hypothetical protein [Oscillospiraceae bacterium]